MENNPHPTASPTDESLAELAARGDSAPFASLVERYAAKVVSVVEQAIGDHHLARDLAQEIWMKVHLGLAGFESGRKFRPWLFAIAMNHVRDSHRKRARRPEPLRLEEHSALPSHWPDEAEAHTQREAIEAALQRVPEAYRAAVHLVDVLGLDTAEAALALGCNQGTVKSRVHRGRRAFQEAYLGRPSEPTRSQHHPR